jgi:NitT/TauT family transport system permease protein
MASSEAVAMPGRSAAGWRRLVVRNGLGLVTAPAFFLIWEAVVRLFHVPLYIVPPPSAVLWQLWRNLPRIAEYTLVTGGETVGGFLIAVALGVPMALAIAFSLLLRQTLYPVAVTLEMIPKITFAPLFVTWFGFGYLPKLIIVFLVCFFPILLNGILAFSSLPTELGRLCLSTGASAWRTFWHVRLPAALPQLFVGIKGAAINATVGATISEWIGGDAGLGYYIQIATGDLRMDLAFAIIIVLALLGLALFGSVVLMERLLIPWHISQRAPLQGRTAP